MNQTRPSLPWLAAGAATVLLLLGLSWLGDNPAVASNELPRFVGRFHPLALHLPIGTLFAVFALEALALLNPRREYGSAILTLLGITALTALPAALCGVLLSWEGGYNEFLLQRHLWLGALTTGLSFALIAFRWHSDPHQPSSVYRITLVIAIALIALTGHYGGSLTHGEGYLTRYWPFSSHPETAEPSLALAATAPQSFYDVHIQPVLQDHCVNCHGPDKSKGDFRLDSHPLLLTSGENAPALVPGDSFNSLLIEQLRLPLDHDNHMPPKGKSQPTEEEIVLLSWWIDQGADPKAEPDASTIPPKIARIIGAPSATQTAETTTPPSVTPWNEIQATADSLSRRHALEILPLSASDHRLRVRSSSSATRISDGALAALAPFATQIAWLDASRAELSPEGAKSIAAMENLERLTLNNATVGDEHLAQLAGLRKLAYLNLFGTQISDIGLRTLENIPSLRQVYLWQTDATPDGIARLHAQLYDNLRVEALRKRQAELDKEIQALSVSIEGGIETSPLETANTQ